MFELIALDIDPNVVKPGWTPFIITLVLAAVMVVLYRSMRHQFGRIRKLPTDAEVAGRAASPGRVGDLRPRDAAEADDGAAGRPPESRP